MIDGGIGEGLFKVIERRLIVAYLSEAGGQRSVGTSNLIDITVVLEYVKGTLCQIACQHIFVDAIGIDKAQSWHIISQQLVAVFGLHEMLRQGFKGVGGEVRIAPSASCQETTHEVVELLLVNLQLGSLGDDATCTDVVEIVKELSGVALHLIGIDGIKGFDGLSFKTHIIIIGRIDDRIFCFGIEQTTTVVVGQGVTLFIDATDSLVGQLTELMELTVTGATLTEAHLLDIGNKALHLVIGGLYHLFKKSFGFVVFHAHDMDESEVIQSLCPTRTIPHSELCSTSCVGFCGVDVTVVIGVGKMIQLVDRLPIWTATG